MKLLIHKISSEKLFIRFIFPILLFATSILIYKLVYPVPRTWYQHYLYQAKSFLSLRVDLPDLPEYYQDKIIYLGKTLTPFPPMPAVILIPFIFISKNIQEQEVSFIIGAINIALVFLLVSKYTSKKIAVLISIFFGFGTVAFWSSIVGTTWYFAHTVAIMFMLLSLISVKEKKYYLSGLLFALAALSRLSMLAGGVYFFLELYKKPKYLINFLAGAFLFIPVYFLYNFLRFDNIFETGYIKVYKEYISSGYPYTIRQLINPNAKYFGYMDIRNIYLHLYTFLIMPPLVSTNLEVTPSPYGMGIIFTTPLLLIAIIPNFRDKLQRNLFIGAMCIAMVDFMHYMQGWVQFGYRFLLDFLPFLLVIMAIKMKLTNKVFLLFIISLIINYWGVVWGIKLGW